MVCTISLCGDAARRPVRLLGFLGEVTEVDGEGRAHIFHGPWRPTQRGAIRAAEAALVRRRYFPAITA